MNKAMKSRLAIHAGLLIALQLTGASHLFAQFVWLNQLDLSAATQGFGVPQKNKSVDGNVITIAGQKYERSFGTHAESSLTIQLDGKANLFSAQVGIDDEVKGHEPAAEFIVIGDKKQLWSSGIMNLGDAAEPCSVSLTGVQKLELVVTEGGNGNCYDHADWANAKFEAMGATNFATINPIPGTPYILTPPPSAKPRINGAGVFVIRPGSPFQFRVAATGDRPMNFTAKGFPSGLQMDPQTGIITGKLAKAGTFVISLTAKNAKGKAEKNLRIECGDRIALRPPMGWNS